MPQARQPYVHDLATVFAAPTQVLSRRDGGIAVPADAPSAQGVIHADVRVLSLVTVTVDGQPGEHLATEMWAAEAIFTSVLPHVGLGLGATNDPQVRLDRRRTVEPGLVTETLTLSSVLPADVDVLVAVEFATDAAPMATIRAGTPLMPRPFDAEPFGDELSWSQEDILATILAPGAELALSSDGCRLTASWVVTTPVRGQVAVTWQLAITDLGGAVIAATTPPIVLRPAVKPVWRAGDHRLRPAVMPVRPASDHRLRPWLQHSVDDLNGLRLATPDAPDDMFFGAGMPWYLTLFGRDSIWAARMLLPIDLEPARGTLRTLARWQGTQFDSAAAEEPGKILHELRRGQFNMADLSLPPAYYGTIDATPLWICLLHDAWRAGLPDAEVADLLPALQSALNWLIDYGDADGDGFLEYRDKEGGLANQGWKDSGDSVRFADGRIARGSIALCEVQGYAYEAAMSGSALLDAFERPGGDRYRRWAADLADCFRTAFWCDDGDDRFPAIALDSDKQRVDSLTSNVGHLLGTGILNHREELLVARRVSSHALDSGLGLRTMSATDRGYSPLSYHCGSVWPHDTAIVVAGLHKAGLAEYADGLVEGLLRASVAFEQRLPELWSGEGRPIPYPTACRPQAWSAAAAVVVAEALGALG
jgi:N-terminal domain of (some) glycogen debranching enzymes/Amylo-alpha-1,6-glucosidase